jgi:hypothetical protein
MRSLRVSLVNPYENAASGERASFLFGIFVKIAGCVPVFGAEEALCGG